MFFHVLLVILFGTMEWRRGDNLGDNRPPLSSRCGEALFECSAAAFCSGV